jgi:hypothetical protein
MKILILSFTFMMMSLPALAEGEKASRNIDCCHTGLCKTDIPLCPGVSRNPERREASPKKPKQSSRSSKVSNE